MTITSRTRHWAQYPPGWHDLVQKLERELEALPINITVVQVKEKFGALRYYVDIDALGDRDEAEKANMAIQTFEAESIYICEKCGKPGETRTNTLAGQPVTGWMRTLCQDHQDEYAERMKAHQERLNQALRASE